MRQPYVVPRRRLLFAVWLTAVALPVLVIDNIPRTEARAAVTVVAPDASEPPVTSAATTATTQAATALVTPATDGSATDEPVAARPTATSAPTTTAPKPVTVQVKAPPRTAAPPTTAPPATAPASTNSEEGGASWYAYNAGECAHRSIPKGTVVTVTRMSTGASVTCVVTDRGPFGDGRIIDLDRSTFSRLADPGAGVIDVRVTW